MASYLKHPKNIAVIHDGKGYIYARVYRGHTYDPARHNLPVALLDAAQRLVKCYPHRWAGYNAPNHCGDYASITLIPVKED